MYKNTTVSLLTGENPFYQNQLEENFLKSLFQKLTGMISKLISSLGFGQTKKVSFRSLKEENLHEAGGWQPTTGGVYAEKVAAYQTMKILKENGFEVEESEITESLNKMNEYREYIEDALEKGEANGKTLRDHEIKTMRENIGQYEKMGNALAKRMIVEMEDDADARVCSYKILHTGGSASLESTADLVIEKMTEQEVKKRIEFSLKSYISSGETTRGTTKDAFGVLGYAIGIKNMTSKTAHKHKDKFLKEFGQDLSVIADLNRQWTQYFYDLKVKFRKDAKKPSDAVKMAKDFLAKQHGMEIIDFQVMTWQKLFEIAATKKKKELVQAVLEILDLRPNSPKLITAGISKEGEIQTFKKCSSDLMELLNAPIENIEVEVTSNIKDVPKDLQSFLKKKKRHSSTMVILFKILGKEVYRVESQTYTNGGAQFSAKAYGKINNADLDVQIKNMFE